MPTLFVARHAETQANVPGEERLRGQSDEFVLTAAGKKQAKQLGAELHTLGVRHVATDTTRRARQTADYVALALGVEPIHDSGLLPWDIGAYEGMYEDVAKESLMWFVRNPHTAPPAGERYAEFFNRWRDAFWYYLSRVRETAQNWALVCHSGHFATLEDVVLERGSTPTADFEPAPGAIMAVDALAPLRVQQL